MNSTLRRGLLVSLLCLTSAALAAGLARGKPPPPPPSSVAIVDLAKLTNSLDEAKVLKDRLKAQADDYQKRLQEVNDELTKVTADLKLLEEKKGTTEFITKLARKYELEATRKARGEGLQQLIDIAEGENMKIMFTNVVEAVGRIGKERGYDVILWDDRAIMAPQVVATGAQVWGVIRDRRIMFASERVDITNDVLVQMNNEFKAGKKP